MDGWIIIIYACLDYLTFNFRKFAKYPNASETEGLMVSVADVEDEEDLFHFFLMFPAELHPPPTDVAYKWLDAFTVNLSWKVPNSLSDKSDIKYLVKEADGLIKVSAGGVGLLLQTGYDHRIIIMSMLEETC